MTLIHAVNLIKQSGPVSSHTWFFKFYDSSAALVLLVLMLPSLALADSLYRWVDSTGKIQYTDLLPPVSAKNVQEKNFIGNVIENDAYPYVVTVTAKHYPVVLYVTKCGPVCDKARALLKTRGVPYSVKNPETTPADAEALKKLVGVLEVPVLVVGKKPLKGFEATGWNAALDDAGYPKAVAGRSVVLKPAAEDALAEIK